MKPYGAFVDLGGGLSGLLHISEISHDRIQNVDSVLGEGDLIKVGLGQTLRSLCDNYVLLHGALSQISSRLGSDLLSGCVVWHLPWPVQDCHMLLAWGGGLEGASELPPSGMFVVSSVLGKGDLVRVALYIV